MGKYNFDEIVERHHTGSYKWDVKDNELPMWIADMDFHVLPEIKGAIIQRACVDAYGYAKCPDEYFESYKEFVKRNYDLSLDTKWMVFSSGVVASIDSILKHKVPKGSGVVIMTPVYHVFFHCIENNEMKVVECPLVYDGSYRIDFNHLEELLKDKNNKCLLLCNPHNPIGRCWNENELKQIVDLCDQYHVLLVSDEIHGDITKPGVSYTPIYKVTHNAIALVAPSKTFNIAGLHSSLAIIADDELRNDVEAGFGHDDIGEPNYIAGSASIAAYQYGDEWVKEMRNYIFNNKEYIKNFLRKELPELKLIDNDATYLLWIDVSKYTNDSQRFTGELRKETGLFVSPGKQFGTGGEGFIRVNIATSLNNVKDACNRLQKYIKTLQ